MGTNGVMDNDNLCARIRDARIANGIFEDDMATQYQISIDAYIEFERGDLALPESTILQMAADLGIPGIGSERSQSSGRPSEHAELP